MKTNSRKKIREYKSFWRFSNIHSAPDLFDFDPQLNIMIKMLRVGATNEEDLFPDNCENFEDRCLESFYAK